MQRSHLLNQFISADGPDAGSDAIRQKRRAIRVTAITLLTLAAVLTAMSAVFVGMDSGHWIGWANLAFVPPLLVALAINQRGHHTIARITGAVAGSAAFAMPTLATGSSDGVEMWIVPMMALPPLLVTPSERGMLVFLYALFGLTFVAVEAYILYLPASTDAVPMPGIARFTNLIGVTVVTTAIVAAYRRIIVIAEARLTRERERAERLLANILPDAISFRLQRDEFPIADKATEVTVLFADVVNFTLYAAAHPADEVVNLLNRLFYAFDDMVERRGLEKIKTIGDAYMVAGGVPVGRPDHAAAVAELALEMLRFVADTNRDSDAKLALRIGIHSGPVVAGVIGKRKFSYDLWGDTVNTAARLEAASEPGRVHLSEATARRLDPRFSVEERGSIALKGLGEMRTYFLAGMAA